MALPKPQPRPAGQPAAERTVIQRAKSNGKVQAPAFIRASSAVKPRLILNIQGTEKSGKDHMGFSYTGGPIYVHSFDIGLDGVVQKFQDSREIYVAEYELTIQPGEAGDKEVGEAANVVWEQFVSNYRDSLASTRDAGLVMIDTGTETWELLRLASFGKLTQVMPHHYSKPNAEFRDLVREGFDATNVVWLHKMKDEWENYIDNKGQEKGRRTGNKKAMMMNDIPFLVECNVQTGRSDDGDTGCQFFATIIDCRKNMELRGMVIDNYFDTLLNLVVGSM